ncbi:hypothetical protein TTHERM_000486559 (macronuclear) [Tetrahymena thermophila SB210]|uniref:Uncharacterized protein n=1 Tax=Tetrahymena thermophila (strain SB210) TaxID=312017 RepID=W7X984_TETTS|nr:hypothetical protein TTHERM_000486559 [Tetrahymena thermophila SB210]EWS72948.1 hypothetical protein TTHERM_000486559 [Tetrahymena thermophila SB210]|eukprot:XP_012654515.1 hypothetical protein TTHERM_000486559 [Tetrahymena thermophila SB210]
MFSPLNLPYKRPKIVDVAKSVYDISGRVQTSDNYQKQIQIKVLIKTTANNDEVSETESFGIVKVSFFQNLSIGISIKTAASNLINVANKVSNSPYQRAAEDKTIPKLQQNIAAIALRTP